MSGDFNRSYVVTDNGNGTFTVQSVAYDGLLGTTRINDNDPIGDPLTIGEAIIEDNGALPPFNSGTFYGYVGAAAPSGVLMAVTGGTDGLAGNIVLFTNDTYPLSQVISFTSGTTAFCFAEGTSIATTKGEVYVENLQIGDAILTDDGNTVPIKWIGRQTVMTRFGPAERLMPVRFDAGSLGQGLPHTDLTVTADHGMLVEDVICHAGALVNGTTITRVPLSEMGETYTVYHIETEEHEIILANGAPAETFIDNVSRRVFDNFAEFEALYGDVPEMEELSYPRAMSARQVPQHIRARLSGKAAA